MNPLLAAALEYYYKGWSILPVKDKIPAIPQWKHLQEQRMNEEELIQSFANDRATGIAVILGSVSGHLAARDFDDPESYHRWADANTSLAGALPTVQTSRGFHVYCRAHVDCITTFDDGEFRGKGYTVLPPSLHASGLTYTWTIPLTAIDSIPFLSPEDSGLMSTKLHDREDKEDSKDSRHPRHTLHVSDIPVQTSILSNLPSGPGQRNRKLFLLARSLKAIIPKASREELRSIISEWHSLALPFITTKDFTTTWVDFSVAWDAVKIPLGASLTKVRDAVKSTPYPASLPQYDLPEFRLLVCFCAALQKHHGHGKPWPLSCRVAGKEIGVSHDTAARFLKMMVSDGILTLYEKGGRRGSKKAAMYLYNDPK